MGRKENLNDSFGNTASSRMPRHLFGDVLSLDHATAIPADISRQNYSVCPRYWYVDAEYQCRRCKQPFIWSAAEQQVWFEEYFFWIDVHASCCLACRQDLRHLAALRKEYDEKVAAARHGSAAEKRRIIEIIDELLHALGKLPDKMIETRRVFERQHGSA
jgi:hypothetical protein